MRCNKCMMKVAALILVLTLLLTATASASVSLADGPIGGLAAPLSGNPLQSGMLEANSNRQIHPYGDEPVESRFDLNGFEKVAESDELELWLNRQF